jgi:ribonuclease HI/probable phosphoglycerate mutase
MMQHVENSRCAGAGQIHRGIRAWEDHRDQQAFTVTGGGGFNDYGATEDAYDYQREEYVCCICDKGHGSLNSLNQHLRSGVHDADNYQCRNCGKTFGRASNLFQHNETCSAGSQARLGAVLMRDFASAGALMLENGSAHSEATLWFDGAANPNPGAGGAGFTLVDDITCCEIDWGAVVITSIYPCTNNQAEYIGLIEGLQCASEEGVRNLRVKGDSNLVIQQMLGNYEVRSDKLFNLYNKADDLRRRFHSINFEHVPRGENFVADAHAKSGAQGGHAATSSY